MIDIIPDWDVAKDMVVPVLDHGFVRLEDSMGTDNSIVRAARVSYQLGTKIKRSDRGLIRYLMRNRHCYDDQTEVLTSTGFIKWHEVTGDMKLGVWDEEAKTLCYEVPGYLTRDYYNGDMYRVDHGGVDLLVTPEHSMWVKTKVYNGAVDNMVWSDGYSLIPANELGNRSMVRYSKLAPYNSPTAWKSTGFPECADSMALLEFIGFFVGDGSATGSCKNCVHFHLKKQRKITFVHCLAQRLGWEIRDSITPSGSHRIRVFAEGISQQFTSLFYTVDGKKCLPEWCLQLNVADSTALLNGLRNSDGAEKRGAWEYSTNSSVLSEQMQLLGLHAGEACHIGHNSSDMYRVMFMSRMHEPIINQGAVNTSMVSYEGYVYCAKTRTGILVIRRNGKIILSGNTTPFEMVEFVFHVKLPIFVARQWMRHRTLSYNEASGRFSIMPDEYYLPPIDRFQTQDTKNKQASSGEQIDGAVELQLRFKNSYDAQRILYDDAIELGTSREIARIDLPLAQYTEFYVKGNLKNWLHFVGLRSDGHAQPEIQVYSDVLFAFMSLQCPLACEAFIDYAVESTSTPNEVLQEILKQSFDFRVSHGLEAADDCSPAMQQWAKEQGIQIGAY